MFVPMPKCWLKRLEWDNGPTIMKDEINAAVGKLSPIGYYTEEVYYELVRKTP